MNKVREVGLAILADIQDRRGIRQALQDVDEETYLEIERDVGRAAIAAMRRETPAMIRAGDQYCGAGKCGNGPVTEDVWQAMIDAALEE